MDSISGGLSSDERQRLTAANIAREKVLAAYGATSKTQPDSGTYKKSPINPSTPPDLAKYHSAWQNYYQKYYSQYYAQAAKQYLDANTQSTQPNPTLTDQVHRQPTEAEVNTVAHTLRESIKLRSKNKKPRSKHFIPLIIGLTTTLTILFLQYNRLIFAPLMAYVSPKNTADTGITALDPTITKAPSADPKLIIPKLNIDVPVAFNISNDENTVMSAMNHGVAHFSIPGANALPGETGNLVITGHSAGDIYSNNQYKFIFSGLERLNDGDLIYVNHNSTRYTYSVTRKETVEPTNVAALTYPTDKPVLTLITCTPLGTSRYRLLVTAEQINPAPTKAKETSTPSSNISQAVLPSNEKSFFEKIWDWLTGKN